MDSMVTSPTSVGAEAIAHSPDEARSYIRPINDDPQEVPECR
jgi:hypothetical protein